VTYEVLLPRIATEVNEADVRAELLMVELAHQSGEAISVVALRYANRLSDFLFAASRYANQKGAGEVLWVPGQKC
jgi:cob(I)alamin adenosyltransferase